MFKDEANSSNFIKLNSILIHHFSRLFNIDINTTPKIMSTYKNAD